MCLSAHKPHCPQLSVIDNLFKRVVMGMGLLVSAVSVASAISAATAVLDAAVLKYLMVSLVGGGHDKAPGNRTSTSMVGLRPVAQNWQPAMSEAKRRAGFAAAMRCDR